MKWQSAIRKVQREHVHRLESIKGAEVTLKKFSILAQEKMAIAREGYKTDEDGIPIGLKEGDLANFHKIALRYGVLDSNLTDEAGEREDFEDEDFLDRLLTEAPEVEQEIFDAVMAFNAPLASGNDGQSSTAASGGSTAAGSDEGSDSPTG